MRIKRALLSTSAAILLSLALPGIQAYEALRRTTELRLWNEAKAYGGYTLFAAMGASYLIDMQGRVVNDWQTGINPRLLDNGHLLDGVGGDLSGFTGFRELDWSGNVAWEYYEKRSRYSPHHDFARIYNPKLKSFTTLYIAGRTLTHVEAIAAGCDPANGSHEGAQADAIVEVDMNGLVVWEWCFFDHGIQDVDSTKANYVGSGKTIASYPGRINLNLPGKPLRANWLECNSLDYNQQLDQVVINSGHGEFYVIDHGNTFVAGNPERSLALAASSAGDFLYRFGDPARYKQGDPPSILKDWTNSTTGNKQIGGSNHVQWIEEGLPGAGNFLVFNNGHYLFERTSQSAILQIEPFRNSSGKLADQYVNPPDAGYTVVQYDKDTHKSSRKISNQIVWTFSSKSNQGFFSPIGSSCQRLPNGNALICAMTSGQMFEVTTDGELVWDYVNPVTSRGVLDAVSDSYPSMNAVFRAYRYGPDHPAISGRSLTPRGTLTSLNRTSHFPWLAFDPSATTAGIGLVNPTSDSISVQLTAYDASGNVLGGSSAVNLPSQEQSAFQADARLGLVNPVNAWMKAEFSRPGIQGFFLAELFPAGRLSGLDGAPMISTATVDGIIPRVKTLGGYTTQLVISNPGDTSVSVTITGYGDALSLDGGVRVLPPRGCLYLDVATLVKTSAPFDGYLRLRSTGAIIGNALIRFGSESLSSVNLVPISQAAVRLSAPHVVRIRDLYYSELSLVNPGDSEASVTLSTFTSGGAILGAPIQTRIAASQRLVLRDEALSLPSVEAAEGWIRVDSSAGNPLIGTLTIGSPTDNHFESAMPLQGAGSREFYFGQVANGSVGGTDYWTGIAVLNTSPLAAKVAFRVCRSDGSLNGNEATVSLAPGQKYVGLLSQLPGIGALASQSSGYLYIMATEPVLAFELFGDNSQTFLSAVPAR
jgi:Arylsulfotransferase (ASST)/Family of unknown function (DUF5719)